MKNSLCIHKWTHNEFNIFILGVLTHPLVVLGNCISIIYRLCNWWSLISDFLLFQIFWKIVSCSFGNLDRNLGIVVVTLELLRTYTDSIYRNETCRVTACTP